MEYPLPLRAQHVRGAQIFADRKELIASLSDRHFDRIAEVGVALGGFSEFLIETLQPNYFEAYDTFILHQLELFWGQSTAEIFGRRNHREYYEDRFSTNIAAGRLKIYEGDSSTCMALRPDSIFDLIYIDGDHTYVGAKKDADVAIRKLKPTGLLVFNDYGMGDRKGPYGVVHVVNDLCVNHGWRISHFALQFAMLCDVVLIRD